MPRETMGRVQFFLCVASAGSLQRRFSQTENKADEDTITINRMKSSVVRISYCTEERRATKNQRYRFNNEPDKKPFESRIFLK
jgi:hypothetical protein